jgi:hypothetical protein
MFGFEKCTERQKEHLDKLVDYFIFSLEGQAYIKEKLQEHDRKQVLRVNPMSLNTEKIQQMAMAILQESEKVKTKSKNYCDYYIYHELKPTLAVHEKSFESDRERYEEIFGEKFVAAIVEKAKENGWQAWK